MIKEKIDYFINGNEPPIIGDKCQSLYLVQHQEGSKITDQANAIFLQFSGKWYQLYFDGNTIFWRETERPEEPVNKDLSNALVLINLNNCSDYVGKRLEDIYYDSGSTEISIDLIFEQGKNIKIQYFANKDKAFLKCW